MSTIGSLDEALGAINHIVEQGEGPPGNRDDSHYRRFLAIREEYLALMAQNESFAPAWPGADSPVMRRPPDPEGKTFVDCPDAARVLDFANAIYSVLLRCLVQAFGREGAHSVTEQRRYIGIAIDLMHCSRSGEA